METEAGIKRNIDADHEGDETSMIWSSMTCRHPGKLLEQALIYGIIVLPEETWLYRCQADPKTLHAYQNTHWSTEDLTKETVLCTAGLQSCDVRQSQIALTHRESV